MFESAELGHTLDKATYDRQVPQLREDLLDAQFDLAQAARFPVILLVGGVDGAGKGETVNLLNEWMDPRHIVTHAMGDPTQDEAERPEMWRFWQALPPKGKIGIFFGSWYTWPILRRVWGQTKNAELEESLDRIVRFERMLAAEGALILKLWLHLSKEGQRKRLKELEKDPRTRWRVTERDWEHHKLYDKFRKVSEQGLRHTSTAEAPWLTIEGTCPRYRAVTVGTILLQAIRKRLEEPNPKHDISAPPLVPSVDNLHLLRALDLSVSVSKKNYTRQLDKQQQRLALLTRDPRFKKRSLIAVFEGNDAAGKGGSIRRVTGALDARQYNIVPIAAPTDEERAQPYLWRFWRHIPRRGRVLIFDRSWYGRVLVERVEGFCSEDDWMRAYGEIVDFEEELTQHGIVLVKFWLAISKDEQLRRFKERETIRFKRFKITDEDWRNREKWDAYEQAVCDMVDRTSTSNAPWTLVEANDKLYARIKVLKTLADRLEAAL